MKCIKNILVPFNLLPPAIWGLEYALDFAARDPEIVLHLFCVGKKENKKEIKTKIEVSIDNLVKEHPAFRGEIKIHVKNGNLVERIIKAQQKLDADIIVMGTAGSKQGKEDHSNTADLVLKADCPVIVIPGPYEEFIISKIALILGPGQIEDASNLEVLLDFARRFNAKVHVLTIYNKEEDVKDTPGEEYNEQMLKYYLDKFYITHAYKESQDLEVGIFDYVDKKEINVLAILPRNHSKKSKPSEGKLTKLLTLKTRIPLLTID